MAAKYNLEGECLAREGWATTRGVIFGNCTEVSEALFEAVELTNESGIPTLA